MSSEISNTQIIENPGDANSQDNDQTAKKIPQLKNIDQPYDLLLDQLKQKTLNGQLKPTELLNAPLIKKKNPKSKIEINSLNQSGPISPYTVFLKHMHKILIEANKNLSFSKRSVLIANVWALMSEKDKEPFKYAANKVNTSFT